MIPARAKAVISVFCYGGVSQIDTFDPKPDLVKWQGETMRNVGEVRTVTDDDAWRMKVALARREGLLVGISAGAAVKVALDVARELGSEKANVVTVLADTGERYFSLEEHFQHLAKELG